MRRSPSSPQGSYEEGRTSRVAGPTRKELNLTSTISGGYDDNLAATLGGSSVSEAMPSGSTAYADATLAYERGNNLRSLLANATGTLHAYPSYIDHVTPGGAASVKAMTILGRNLALSGSQRVGYQPFFSVFSLGTSTAALPTGLSVAAPLTGLYERRSWSSNTMGSLERRWGRRDWTTVSYSYDVLYFTDSRNGNSTAQAVRAEQRHALSHGVRLRGEYYFGDAEYWDTPELKRPTREHRLWAGPELDKALSRARHLNLSIAVGPSHVASIDSITRTPWSSWVPSGFGQITLSLSESWSVDGGYRRAFSTLSGVTDRLYAFDLVYLGTNRFVTRRTEVGIAGTYSNWKTPVASGVNDTLNIYGARLQIRHALSERVSATASYNYYHHRYSNAAALPAGFPPQYDRNAVRVGLVVRVPLQVMSISSSSPVVPR